MLPGWNLEPAGACRWSRKPPVCSFAEPASLKGRSSPSHGVFARARANNGAKAAQIRRRLIDQGAGCVDEATPATPRRPAWVHVPSTRTRRAAVGSKPITLCQRHAFQVGEDSRRHAALRRQ